MGIKCFMFLYRSTPNCVLPFSQMYPATVNPSPAWSFSNSISKIHLWSSKLSTDSPWNFSNFETFKLYCVGVGESVLTVHNHRLNFTAMDLNKLNGNLVMTSLYHLISKANILLDEYLILQGRIAPSYLFTVCLRNIY